MFSIDLPPDFVAEKIIVSEGWGFIVVSCGRKLLLYDVNGFFIREATTKFDVSLWATWCDSKGFDHIAIADNNGNIFAFELFYLTPKSAIHRCCKAVSSINYVSNIESIVVITKDSRSIFIPYQ